MKVGSVEGTPEEVKNFFENHGLDLSSYLEKPDPPLNKIWLILPSITFVVFLSMPTFVSSDEWKLLLLLSGFAVSVWLAASVQIRFKSNWSSSIILIVGFLIMLVANGYLAPLEFLEQFKKHA